MKHLKNNHIALTSGSVFGIFHAVWALLVVMGIAQPLLNWIFDLHMIENPYHVMSFDVGKAVMLVIFTFVVGYVVGLIFSMIWNIVVKK